MSVFSPNTGKYGPEKTSYLDTYGVNLRIQFKYRKIQTKKIWIWTLLMQCWKVVIFFINAKSKLNKQITSLNLNNQIETNP